jgi:phosphatidylglycerophosphatase A
MIRVLTIFFGLGLLRPAAGTWGSLGAVLMAWVILRYLGFPVLVLATVLVTCVGFWSVRLFLRDRPGDDPGEVVIDEVAGQWIAILFPAAVFWWHGWTDWLPWPAPVAAFVFFRLFDIWKPGVIGRADARHDPAGVMLDDLWAGLFAGIATLAAAGLAHGFMMGG